MADHRKMWESLGLDLESHDQLMKVLPPTYGSVYMSQENRPEGMEYFDFVVSEVHGQRIQELQDHKAAGGKVIGAFVFTSRRNCARGRRDPGRPVFRGGDRYSPG